MEEKALRVCSLTDAGIRSGNEDACSVSRIPHPSGTIMLLSVADGLGGHPAGEVASRLVTRTLEQIVREQITRIPDPEPENLKGMMAFAFRETNRRVIITVPLADLLRGRRDTTVGGTDLRCVAEDALARRVRRALIVTDGYVGELDEPLRRRLERARVRLVVLLTPNGWRRDLESLGAPFFELPPLSASLGDP